MKKDFSEKNKKIKEAMKATHTRRQVQACRVFTLKINQKKLSLKQREALKMIFVEGKWLRNAIIAWTKESEDNKPWEYDGNLKSVPVKLRDGSYEQRELRYLAMQMRQSVLAEVIHNIKGLSAAKKKGRKVGALRFTSELKSLNLKQFGMSHKFKSKHRMKLRNIPGTVYVSGVGQIPGGCEIANAKLLNTPRGYYIAITCFIDKEIVEQKEMHYEIQGEIGIDMGRTTSVTLSTGEKINVQIEETGHLKRLQKKLARQTKGSNNWKKTKHLIEKEYQKLKAKRNDAGNKLVHDLLRYERIYMQDENLRDWHNKKVQNSCLGRVKAKLSGHPRVVMLPRTAATTKTCVCGYKQPMHLWDRTFRCEVCGYTDDRDIHAAKNMIRLGHQYQVGLGRTDFKLVEKE